MSGGQGLPFAQGFRPPAVAPPSAAPPSSPPPPPAPQTAPPSKRKVPPSPELADRHRSHKKASESSRTQRNKIAMKAYQALYVELSDYGLKLPAVESVRWLFHILVLMRLGRVEDRLVEFGDDFWNVCLSP